MTDQPEPDSEQPMSWAEVYSTGDCGGCGHADCEHCTSRFLQFLQAHGTSRAAQARGLG